jgi:uncharacterized repeat protein (TIGR03803 family)
MKSISNSRRSRGDARRASAPHRLALCEPVEKRLLMSAYTYQHLADFPGSWQESAEGVVVDSQGNLYGTTLGAGNPGGTVFKIAAGTGTVSTLASFNSSTGDLPTIGLAIDSSGNLYGATTSGGANGHGTLFEISSGSSTITVLASFGSSSGYFMSYGENIIVDSSGNIYGTTQYGGAHGSGTVFELAAGSGTITALASFNSSVTGDDSYAPLTIDSSGDLYGTTQSGGTNNDGTVFEVAHNSGAITPLASFSTTNGGQTNVIVDPSGNVYGTSVEGGSSNVGTVFRINASSGVITTLATFNTTNGSYPEGAIVADAAGNIFGTTESGGSNSVGALFEFSPGNNTISTLYAMNFSTTGGYTSYGVYSDSGGNLYAFGTEGGANDNGAVFELVAPATHTVFTANPVVVNAGTLSSVTVSLETAEGGVVSSDTAQVTLSIASGPSGGTISGTTTVSAVAGVATFTNLTFSTHGTYTLTAASNGLVSGTSNSLAISPTYTLNDHFLYLNTLTGENPVAGLYMDSYGNLYGTAAHGGLYSHGTVFKSVPSASDDYALANFNVSNGSGPNGGLVADSSGNLYGTTAGGGANNDGTVFEISSSSGNISTIASFNGSNGSDPLSTLFMDSGGNLYGTTNSGGANNEGTIFKIAHGTSTITVLASMTSASGTYPLEGVVMDSAGNLYGTGWGGGAYNDGTVWKLASGTNTLTALVSFNGTDGSAPSGLLTIDSAGNLYGGTETGGANNHGTIFKIAAGSGTITTLASLNSTTGINAAGGVLLDSSGDIFATTYSGTGATASGTVIEIPAGSNTVNVLADLNSSGGSQPDGGLIMDAAGNLYTTTYSGGGFAEGGVIELTATASQAVFTTQTTVVTSGTLSTASVSLETPTGVVANTDTATVTLSIASGPSGGTITGTTSVAAVAGVATFTNITFSKPGTYTLTAASSGLTYGTESVTVSQNDALSDIADLSSSTGSSPVGSLYIDSSGNFYGTASSGGTNNDGTVFKIAAGTHTVTTIANFNGTNGQQPEGPVIADSSGDLFGTTGNGGAHNDGTVFEIANGSSTITTLVSFNGSNGSFPTGSLLLDGSGNLYGTTAYGGANSVGTVFEIVHGSGAITTLASMSSWIGTFPDLAGVVEDSSGNFYGTAFSGGANNQGSVWKLSSGVLSALASFNNTNGEHPFGSLSIDSAGNLYGTTETGGANGDGTIYKIAAGTGTITTLTSLSGSTGTDPVGGVLLDSGGDIFGVTASGSGATASGTVIEIPAGSGTVNVLADIGSANVSDSYSPLVMDSQGDLYGTTRLGGANSDGGVFEVASTAATHAAFATYPTTSTAGESQTITVTLQSALGLVDTGNNSTVTLAIGIGPTGATLGGTLTATAVNGVAVFTGITLDTAGSYLLTASSNFPAATSGTITVFPGSFASIDFVNQPQSTVAGQTLGTVSVGLLDAYGNPIAANPSDFVQLELVASNGESLLGTTQQPLVSGGYETFTNLSIDTADTGDQLLAVSSISSDTALSHAFNITPSTAAKLAFTAQPADTVAGQTMSPISVAVEDAYGNRVATDNSRVVVQNFPMVLNGTISAVVSGGIATFDQLFVTLAGTYTITASDGSLVSAVSDDFTVTPAAASQLLFVQQPQDTTAGQTISAIQVAVADRFGNRVAAGNAGVALQTNPMELNGTVIAPVVDGVATFGELDVTKAGSYTITASDGNLTTAASSPFTVAPAAPSRLVIAQQPATVAVGQPIGTVTVDVEDAFGNLEAGDTSSVTLAAAGAALTGTTTVTAHDGVAVFSQVVIGSTGSFALTATDGALAPVSSAAVIARSDYSVNAGAKMATVSINTSSAFPSAGESSRKLMVQVVSASGKVVQSKVLAVKKGWATLTNLMLKTSGLYTLIVTDAYGHTLTKTIAVNPAAAKQLAFASAPVVQNAQLTATVQVEDRYGNVTRAADGTLVTLKVTSASAKHGTTSPTVTLRATVLDGIATFSDASLIPGVKSTLLAADAAFHLARSQIFVT